MGYFYTDSNNQVHGPMTENVLKELLNEGKISAQTFIIEESETQWKTYTEYFSVNPIAKQSSGLTSPQDLSSGATTTLYTLTHTGPINIRPIEIAKKTPKAILLKDYTRLADGTKKKLLMIGVDTVSKTPKDAINTFIVAQQDRVSQLQQQLTKEQSKLAQALQLLKEIDEK